MDRQTDKHIDEQMAGYTNRIVKKDRQVNRWTGGRVYRKTERETER
jgi:hypothetical protein